MHGCVRVVFQHHGDAVLGRVVGQADPSFGADDGERVQLPGVAHEQAAVEPLDDLQQHVRPHLVGLVEDRPSERGIADGGPLGRGTDDDPAVGEVRGAVGYGRVREGVDGQRCGVGGAAQAADRDVRMCGGEPDEQVVDLVVRLGDDDRPLAAAEEVSGGADHQGAFAGSGRRVHDHGPVVAPRGRSGSRWWPPRPPILWHERTGAPWRDLPERYGPWKTAHERLRKWTADGTWDRILEQVIVKDDSLGTLGDNVEFVISVDSTSVQAHQHAAGARKKGGCADRIEDLAVDGECLGRSRGGLTTKIHLAVDVAGLPLAVILTPGQAGDV